MTDFHRIERHEGVFTVKELDWENRYYAAMLDGKPYAYMHIQTVPGMDFAMLHITLFGFSRRILRECLADYVTLNRILRESGIKKMVHLKDPPYRKWEKLMRVLGFDVPQFIKVDGKLHKTVCMEVI